ALNEDDGAYLLVEADLLRTMARTRLAGHRTTVARAGASRRQGRGSTAGLECSPPGKRSTAGMAVENDYELLVFNLNQVVGLLFKLQDEVEKRLVEEKAGRLDPNATQWVNFLSERVTLIQGLMNHLKEDASQVLMSRRGEPGVNQRAPSPPGMLGERPDPTNGPWLAQLCAAGARDAERKPTKNRRLRFTSASSGESRSAAWVRYLANGG